MYNCFCNFSKIIKDFTFLRVGIMLSIQVTAANLRPLVIFSRDVHNVLGTELHRLGAIYIHVLQMEFPIPAPPLYASGSFKKIVIDKSVRIPGYGPINAESTCFLYSCSCL